jgi:hypothetical protein
MNNVVQTGRVQPDLSPDVWACRVTKYDPEGMEIWSNVFDEYDNSMMGGGYVAIGPSDEIYVYGGSARDPEEWLLKYSSDGELQWAQRIETNFVGHPFDLAVHSDGSAYLLTNVTRDIESHDDDIVVLKYSADGTREWVRSYNGIGTEWVDDWPGELTLDDDGNVYVVGYSGNDANTRTTHGIVTIKYSPDGDLAWVQRYDYGVFGDEGDLWYDWWTVSVHVDDQSNVFVAGRNAGTEGYEHVTIKYDPSGDLLWSQRYKDENDIRDEASDVLVDSEGEVFVAGLSTLSGGIYHLLTVDYNASGALLGEDRRSIARIPKPNPPNMAMDGNGDVYVASGRELRKYVRVPSPPGPTDAVYDPVLKVPLCTAGLAVCDTGETLIDGRHEDGPEPNHPNTIYSSCEDGESLSGYHVERSIDRLRVSTVDGEPFAPGKTVRVEALVWPYEHGGNYLRVYYTADAANPSWTLITSQNMAGPGTQVLSATFVLPEGKLQAVRGSFYVFDSDPLCGSHGIDVDDLAFRVKVVKPQPRRSSRRVGGSP